MLPDHPSFSVEDKGMRDHVHVHGTLEIPVLIQEDIVIPVVTVGKGFNLRTRPGIINGYGNKLYTGFFLPVVIFIGNGIQLLDAGLAPECPETQDNGVSVVADVGSIERDPFNGLQVDGRQRLALLLFVL